ncbi:MAG: D-glycero-beta-D-manno-heptose 1-phosphate adenylyltransferase [Bacteroidota bacterium]|nr:D-glycero-beta-D-manno-heptose 1-phosphate adenylyltransferase [Bacteroidota bacterium]
MSGKTYALSDLVRKRAVWKEEKRKVVFTNGVFDILHRGHGEYLAAAKQLGDVLIVGVNSDASVRCIKGPLRPIVPEDDRAYLVSQLVPVDAVCIFAEETPLSIISALVPDVLVKGADWDVNDVIGKDVVEAAGGTVRTIPFVPNRSTTTIIDVIKARYTEPVLPRSVGTPSEKIPLGKA